MSGADPELGSSENALCHHQVSALGAGATESFACAEVIEGQYVSIQKFGGLLTVCEVEVYPFCKF